MGSEIPPISSNTALDILVRLEQGVPPEPEHVPHVRVGRQEEEERLCDRPIEGLQSVKRGNGQIFFVLGDFGYGKSFFINLLAHRAAEMDMLRSRFDIQDVSDISDKPGLYKSIVGNIQYPDQRGRGVLPLLRQFCERVDRKEFKDMAISRNFSGHPIYEILLRLLKAWNQGGIRVERDDVFLDQAKVLDAAAKYLQGEDVSLEGLHAIGKKGFDKISKENVYEYLKHIRSLSLELGYNGIAILIDEAAEELDWSPDSDTTQTLIDLYNKCFQRDQFSHMMFVFVGNEEKWDSLIEETGHQALSDRYHAKKLVLDELEQADYVRLVKRVKRLLEAGEGIDIDITDKDARAIVREAAEEYGGVSGLSPRRLLLFPQGNKQGPTLLEILRDF